MPDRVLATILFTDIASSTVRAAEVGDRRWREPRSGSRIGVSQSLRGVPDRWHLFAAFT
jgi:hypothetical protein